MPLSSMLTTVDGHWELQVAALLKAVWWDFRLADGLVLVLLAFVVLGSVSSVLCQEIGCKERLRNARVCCVEWVINQS